MALAALTNAGVHVAQKPPGCRPWRKTIAVTIHVH